MDNARPDLAGHPDKLRWNAKYAPGTASFQPHPLAVAALSMTLPDGPVLDLASGPSGSVLLAAGRGRRAVAVDVSDVALNLLAAEVRRRGLTGLVTLVHADLTRWRPEPDAYSVVLCTGYWDRELVIAAAAAVVPSGLLGWEAFTVEARQVRPELPEQWCMVAGEPATLLPDSFAVLSEEDLIEGPAGAKRRMLARRTS